MFVLGVPEICSYFSCLSLSLLRILVQEVFISSFTGSSQIDDSFELSGVIKPAPVQSVVLEISVPLVGSS